MKPLHLRRTVATCAVGVAASALLVVQGGAAQASSFVAQWRMNDSGDTMRDSTGNGHTGTLYDVDTGQDGYSGDAFGFFGSSSYVLVPDRSSLDPGTSYWKVSMRVKFADPPSSSAGTADLLRKGEVTTAGGSFKVEILADGRARCNFRGSTGSVTVTGGSDLADDRWHSIACGRSSTSVKLMVDGGSVTVRGTTGKISNSSPVIIGAKRSSGDDQYTGLLDEVSISKA